MGLWASAERWYCWKWFLTLGLLVNVIVSCIAIQFKSGLAERFEMRRFHVMSAAQFRIFPLFSLLTALVPRIMRTASTRREGLPTYEHGSSSAITHERYRPGIMVEPPQAAPIIDLSLRSKIDESISILNDSYGKA
jgi:hypothetical protein